MTTETTQDQSVEQDELIEITNLNQFLSMFIPWHKRAVETMKHLLEVPDGTDVQVGDAEPRDIKLTGDVLEGYKIGIHLGLDFLGNLPFKYELANEQPKEE